MKHVGDSDVSFPMQNREIVNHVNLNIYRDFATVANIYSTCAKNETDDGISPTKQVETDT